MPELVRPAVLTTGAVGCRATPQGRFDFLMAANAALKAAVFAGSIVSTHRVVQGSKAFTTVDGDPWLVVEGLVYPGLTTEPLERKWVYLFDIAAGIFVVEAIFGENAWVWRNMPTPDDPPSLRWMHFGRAGNTLVPFPPWEMLSDLSSSPDLRALPLVYLRDGGFDKENVRVLVSRYQLTPSAMRQVLNVTPPLADVMDAFVKPVWPNKKVGYVAIADPHDWAADAAAQYYGPAYDAYVAAAFSDVARAKLTIAAIVGDWVAGDPSDSPFFQIALQNFVASEQARLQPLRQEMETAGAYLAHCLDCHEHLLVETAGVDADTPDPAIEITAELNQVDTNGLKYSWLVQHWDFVSVDHDASRAGEAMALSFAHDGVRFPARMVAGAQSPLMPEWDVFWSKAPAAVWSAFGVAKSYWSKAKKVKGALDRIEQEDVAWARKIGLFTEVVKKPLSPKPSPAAGILQSLIPQLRVLPDSLALNLDPNQATPPASLGALENRLEPRVEKYSRRGLVTVDVLKSVINLAVAGASMKSLDMKTTLTLGKQVTHLALQIGTTIFTWRKNTLVEAQIASASKLMGTLEGGCGTIIGVFGAIDDIVDGISLASRGDYAAAGGQDLNSASTIIGAVGTLADFAAEGGLPVIADVALGPLGFVCGATAAMLGLVSWMVTPGPEDARGDFARNSFLDDRPRPSNSQPQRFLWSPNALPTPDIRQEYDAALALRSNARLTLQGSPQPILGGSLLLELGDLDYRATISVFVVQEYRGVGTVRTFLSFTPEEGLMAVANDATLVLDSGWAESAFGRSDDGLIRKITLPLKPRFLTLPGRTLDLVQDSTAISLGSERRVIYQVKVRDAVRASGGGTFDMPLEGGKGFFCDVLKDFTSGVKTIESTSIRAVQTFVLS